jgi:hypothetical protein
MVAVTMEPVDLWGQTGLEYACCVNQPRFRRLRPLEREVRVVERACSATLFFTRSEPPLVALFQIVSRIAAVR